MTLIDLKRYGAEYLEALIVGAVSLVKVVLALVGIIMASAITFAIIIGALILITKIPNVILWIAGALIGLPIIGRIVLKW